MKNLLSSRTNCTEFRHALFLRERDLCIHEPNDNTRSYENQAYCKFENFRENYIFANGVKRHICDVKNSLLVTELSTSENDRVISPFREGFILAKLRGFYFGETSHPRSFAKIQNVKPSRKFPNLQYIAKNRKLHFQRCTIKVNT